jgi:hypothetical protein
MAEGHLDVAGLGAHIQVILGFEQQPQAAAHDGVIVGEDDRDRVAPGGRRHAHELPLFDTRIIDH